YYHKVIAPIDLFNDEWAGVFKVLNLDAVSTVQFRFLVPLLIGLFYYTFHLSPHALMWFLTVVFIYLTFLAYYRIICIYFKNELFNSLVAVMIIYPLTWNLIAINKIFSFTDTASVFFMTISIYLVLTRNYKLLFPVFFLGALNHYSIGFIIPVFLLFNYRSIFTARILKYTGVLFSLYAGYFIIAKLLLPEPPAEKEFGFLLIDFERNFTHLKISPNHILLRDILFNFGGIHIFTLLFYFSPVWKKIKKEYTIYNLAILIFVSMTLTGFGLFSEELRCYVPILPFLMIPAMIFLSQFAPDLMPLRAEVLAKKEYTSARHAILTN
ncbi:MAG: hypothetical protein HOP31_16150, partial [Ignavibacteria bacterium]|nr:hypothetical protein [Ignavibacteria bacterium]